MQHYHVTSVFHMERHNSYCEYSHVCYVTLQVKNKNRAPPKSPKSYPIRWTVLYVVPRFATAKTGVRGWRWPHGFLHVTRSFWGNKGKRFMCLSCLKQTISTIFTSTSKNKFHISNTYLTGSYSWPDCVIIAFILSSSEALASARLAVCATGNYLTHTLETHLSPCSPRQHHSSNPVKSSTTLAELA